MASGASFVVMRSGAEGAEDVGEFGFGAAVFSDEEAFEDLLENRLGLSRLHTTQFNTPREVPPSNQGQLNGYFFT